MGIRNRQVGSASKQWLSIALMAACGCSLFKKKDDDQPLPAPLTSVEASPPPPPVFNVNPVAAATNPVTAANQVEPTHVHAAAAGHAAGASAKGAISPAVSATPSNTPPAVTAAVASAAAASSPAAVAVPSIPTVALPSVDAIAKSCAGSCTATFSTCMQGAGASPQQLQTCQTALQGCLQGCK